MHLLGRLQNSSIVFTNPIVSGTVSIYNNQGRLVAQIPLANTVTVAIGNQHLSPGLYFYNATNNINGEVIRGKFVVE